MAHGAWDMSFGTWEIESGICNMGQKIIYDLWIVTCDLWPVTCDLRPMTCDLWPVTCDLWPVTCDLWPVHCTGPVGAGGRGEPGQQLRCAGDGLHPRGGTLHHGLGTSCDQRCLVTRRCYNSTAPNVPAAATTAAVAVSFKQTIPGCSERGPASRASLYYL